MIKEEKIKMQIIHDNDTGQGFRDSDQCRFDQSGRKKKIKRARNYTLLYKKL